MRHLVVVINPKSVTGRIGPDPEYGLAQPSRVVPLTAGEPVGAGRSQVAALADIVAWGLRFGAETVEVIR